MGFFDSIGKFFKRVTSSTAGKIAIGLFLGAAIVFTGGAALGVTGLAGGWAGAAGGISGALGLTGTMGSVVTGALTSAGYGAMIGAGISAITGGDILKGAAMGAAGGAITGGVSGALASPAITGATTAADAAQAVGTAGSEQVFNTASNVAATSANPAATVAGTEMAAQTGVNGLNAAAPPPPAAAAPPPPAAPPPSNELGGLGLKTNIPIVDRLANSDIVLGQAVSGLGQGAMGYFGQQGEEDTLRRERNQQIASQEIDYTGLDAGPNAVGAAQADPRASRYASKTTKRRRYRYDPNQRRVVETMEG